MTPSAMPSPTINRVAAEDRAAALELLFSHLSDSIRQNQIDSLACYVAAGGATWEGLLAARHGRHWLGVVLTMPQPGRTAVAWDPRTTSAAGPHLADELLHAAHLDLAARRVRIAQAQLELDAFDDARCLEQAGYEHLAELLYMTGWAENFPREPEATLEFEPYAPHNHDRFRRLIDQTYEQSLDCPKLNGVRDPEDVLASYRATGEFCAEHWLLVRDQGREIGCLLCADHPARDLFELIYMGLVPQARGRHHGAAIVRHAQWLARRARRGQLLTAVDAANAPAARMYTRAGFVTCDRRSTYLRIFPD